MCSRARARATVGSYSHIVDIDTVHHNVVSFFQTFFMRRLNSSAFHAHDRFSFPFFFFLLFIHGGFQKAKSFFFSLKILTNAPHRAHAHFRRVYNGIDVCESEYKGWLRSTKKQTFDEWKLGDVGCLFLHRSVCGEDMSRDRCALFNSNVLTIYRELPSEVQNGRK